MRPTALALLLTLFAPPAWAQPVARSDEAREQYDRGVGFLAEGRYHDAADALERSQRLRPLAVVTYNLALAYRGLGRFGDAVLAFERYLHAPEVTASPERLAAIREELAELRASVVRVQIDVTPAAAALSVDGRGATLAPHEALALDPGAHVFEWSAPDHRPTRREITCVAGEHQRFDVRLEPLREGRLLIETQPATASVTLDGRPLDLSAREQILPPGEHHVELSAPGYIAAHRVVHVGSTGLVRLSVSLAPTRLPGWVLPTAIAGTAAVLAGLATGAYFGLRPTIPAPRVGTWDNVREAP